jgi:hypothetical protein
MLIVPAAGRPRETPVWEPSAFESGKTPVKSATKAVVQAVGDEAYYITTPPFGTALSVRRGEDSFQVRISGFPEAQAAHLEKAVALKLLKRS